MRCSKCGDKLQDSLKFCTSCGTPVEDKTEVLPQSAKKFCTGCGAELSDSEAFCTMCGTPAGMNIDIPDLSDIPEISDIPDVPEIPQQQPTPLYEEVYQNKFCTGCGAAIESTEVFCTSCGQPVEESAQPYSVPDYMYTRPKKKKSNALKIAIIITAVIILLLGTGVGLYYFLDLDIGFINDIIGRRSPIGTPYDDDIRESPRPSPTAEPTDDPDPEPTPTPEPVSTPEPEVESLDITENNIIVTEISLVEDEELMLSSLIYPADVSAEILWTSSDNNVFTITPRDTDASNALLKGTAPGEAVLVVTAGNVMQTCIVRVTRSLPDDEPVHITLGNIVMDTSDGVDIRILWRNREITVFERAAGGSRWMMQSRTGDYRQVIPSFSFRNDAFTIAFTTTTRVYYLFEDGTGYFRNPNGSNSEALDWEFVLKP